MTTQTANRWPSYAGPDELAGIAVPINHTVFVDASGAAPVGVGTRIVDGAVIAAIAAIAAAAAADRGTAELVLDSLPIRWEWNNNGEAVTA